MSLLYKIIHGHPYTKMAKFILCSILSSFVSVVLFRREDFVLSSSSEKKETTNNYNSNACKNFDIVNFMSS